VLIYEGVNVWCLKRGMLRHKRWNIYSKFDIYRKFDKEQKMPAAKQFRRRVIDLNVIFFSFSIQVHEVALILAKVVLSSH